MTNTKKRNTNKNNKYKHTKKRIFYKFNKTVNKSNINDIRESLIKFINSEKGSSFPVKKYIPGKYSSDLHSIKTRMNNLRRYKYKLINKPFLFRAKYDLPSEFLKYRDIKSNMIKPSVLLFDHENYFKYDLISDYFQELVRMKCKRYNSNESPYDFWFGIKNDKYNAEYHTKNIEAILKVCINKFAGKVNAYTLSEAIYQLTNECSSFRPTVIASIIKIFDGRKRILDISSGWGDRLIGAISCGVEYYFGVDPNPEVHKGYDEIRRIFGVSNKKFVIKQEGFEKVKIQMPPSGKKFDLIMTSPPYFDLEVYTKAQGQSVLGRGKKAWLDEFMIPSLKKAWEVLEVNGILALNISNKTDTKLGEGYVEEIIRYMNSMDDSDFRGCIAYGDLRHGTTQLRNPQPIWIWRKLPDLQVQQTKFRELLKKDYNPELAIIPEMIPNPDNKAKKRKIRINVIREDLLEAGAKQRAMIPYFQSHPAKEFVYVSPVTGSAQVTLSYSALYTGKRVSVFMDKREPRHPLTKKAMSYGVSNIVEVPNGGFKKLQPIVDDYVRWKKAEKGDDYIFEFSLGFANNKWIDILAKQLKTALSDSLLSNPPRRIWIPTGSTALVNSLYRVFPADKYPQMRFLVVQTGKTVWDDQVDLSRTSIYRTEEFFYDHARRQPPFPTSRAYDAKAWGFVLDHAEDEDYLVNIIADPVYE